MAGYCLTLPHTPPWARADECAQGAFAGMISPAVLGLFRNRTFAVFATASLLICIPLQFYYAFTNLFVNEIGVHNAASKMTGGQFSELGCLLLIPWFFRRLGVKGMLLGGMAAWTLRYVLFAFGNGGSGMGLLWLGLLLHGICYDFFFVTGQIYVDREAPAAVRSAAQGLVTQITCGAGMLLGSSLSDPVVDHFPLHGAAGAAGMAAWRGIWLVAAGCSAVVLVLFAFSFHERMEAGVIEAEIAGSTTGTTAAAV